MSNVEKQSASVQRCIERLTRDKTARTEFRAEQAVHLAADIKANISQISSRHQQDQRKDDSSISQSGIARVEAIQAAFFHQNDTRDAQERGNAITRERVAGNKNLRVTQKPAA